jgi:hypothetical protein
VNPGLHNPNRFRNRDFFTKLPVPVGEMGGDMAYALLGSAKVLLLASRIRRDRSSVVYRGLPPVLEPRLGRTDVHASRDDLRVCRFSVSGLAPAGLGSRVRAAHHGALNQHHRPIHCRQRKFA